MPFLPRQQEKSWIKTCTSSDHNPPNMIILPSGSHTWQCPVCLVKTTFYVPEITC